MFSISFVRWFNTLNTSIKFGRWSREEDKLLWEAVHKNGMSEGWMGVGRDEMDE